MVQRMIRVFIDESGNLGRGGKYFVLAATVFDTEKGTTRIRRLIHKEQQLISRERKRAYIEEIKSCTLTFSQRQRILTKMVAKADVDLFYIVIDKRKSDLLNCNKPKNLIYNYFAKLLTDAIFAKYNDDFDVVFDQRSTSVKSMNSLTDYITINAYTAFGHASRNVKAVQMDSKTSHNLQAADLIAGTVYQAYDRQNRHFLDIIQPRLVDSNEFPHTAFSGSLMVSYVKRASAIRATKTPPPANIILD